MRNIEKFDSNQLFRDAKAYPHKLKKFEINWIKEEEVIKKDKGAEYRWYYYPVIKIEYQ